MNKKFDIDFDDDFDFDDDDDLRPPKSAYSRRRLEEYMEMKRLKEFLDDDFGVDDYEDRI